MIAAGYTIDLYCDALGCPYEGAPESPASAQFTGQTWAQAATEARKYGWRISRDRTRCACPDCVKMNRQYDKKVVAVNQKRE